MEVINAPGRFDRSPRLLAGDVHHFTSVPGVSVVAFSEVADEARAAVLARHGWTLTHEGTAGRGESAILTKDSARQVVAQRWLKLTDGGGPGRLRAPIVAPAVVTKAPSGRKTLFTMAHLPAHVEGIWAHVPLPARTKAKVLRKSNRTRIRTYLEAVKAWREKVAHLAAEYHVDDVVVMADWNLNAHRKWVQELIANAWPGLNLAATKDPDLGSRTVGFVLTSMDHVGGHVYRAEASDHKAGRYALKHVNAPKVVKPAKAPDPFERCTYNGALMDQKTQAFVQTMEARLGYSLTVVQGCYNPGGVSQSAGTHDGGGVVDLAPADFANKVKVARNLGGFYWHRLPIPGVWGEHIHGGIRNHGKLSPSAARQQDDYDAHPPRDGLAGHNVDLTPHPHPPVGFDYLPAWHAINDEETP